MAEHLLADALRAEVRACLAAAGLSQAAAARELGISAKHLSYMLTGRASISLTWAARIAELCGRELVIRSRRAVGPRKGRGRRGDA